MKTLLFFSVLLIFSQPPKFHVLTYGNPRMHARSIQDFSQNEIILGTNEGKFILVSKKPGKSLSMYLPCTKEVIKEIRDADKNEQFLFFMQSNDTSHLLRIDWSGKSEALLGFTHHEKPVFLDGIDMKDSLGFLIGDPVDGEFSLFRTMNFGKTWETCPGKIKSQSNEAAYAASGTTNHIINGDFVFVSGGEKSRFIWSSDLGQTWKSYTIPFESCLTCGAYSLGYKNRQELVVVGGDYKRPSEGRKSCFYSKDGGLTWNESEIPPNGYRSCVYFAKGVYYACGTTGIDYSTDGGNTWNVLSNENALSMTADTHYLYVSCMGGKVLKMKLLKK
ncbi:MAG: WD40/YVTN/BNR-like repeat-containing protein [Crocinitomicaceae bacterium]